MRNLPGFFFLIDTANIIKDKKPSSFYYDDKYQLIQGSQDLYDGSNGGKESVTYLYNFIGQIKQAKQRQTFGTEKTTVEKWFTYDHAGRLTKTEQQINDANKTTILELTYNELGQVQQKKLGSTQDMDYKYNIRGWLTQINDPDNLGSDMFGMKLVYNDVIAGLGNTAQYNSNISAMVWKNNQAGESIKGYVFNYDPLNRFKSSDYQTKGSTGWTQANAYEEKGINYDANGNILSLLRTNASGTNKDNFEYSKYDGNQLQSLKNLDNSTSYSFLYDSNGNITTDGLRGVNILYNQLNLPRSITKGSDKVSYIYTAAGEKVAKEVNGAFQYYAGNMVYTDGKSLDYLCHEGGVVKKIGSAFTYEYYLKDHLGNVRGVFIPGNSSPGQLTDYYPFGMSHQNNNLGVNKYLYNGKEYQDESFLGMYDYTYRFYDPRTARFVSQDLLANSYPYYSPYQYAGNEVPNAIDLDGLEPWRSTTDGSMHYGPYSSDYANSQGWESTSENSVKITVTNDDVNGERYTFSSTSENTNWGIFSDSWYNLYVDNMGFIDPIAMDQLPTSSSLENVLAGVLYSTPIVGSTKLSSEAFDRGQYGTSAMYFGFGLFEMFTLGIGAEYTAGPKATQIAARSAAVNTVAKAEIKSLPAAFSRFSMLERHFAKHANEWVAITKEAYYKRAISLMDGKVGGNIAGFTNSAGYTFRMNLKTGEFGVMRPNGVIETFFRRLNNPAAYWAEQIAKYGK